MSFSSTASAADLHDDDTDDNVADMEYYNGVTLLDLPDDLLLHVMKFVFADLDFQQRWFYRGTCRHVSRVLDLLPAAERVQLQLLVETDDSPTNSILYNKTSRQQVTIRVPCRKAGDSSILALQNVHSVLEWLRPSILSIQLERKEKRVSSSTAVIAVSFLQNILHSVSSSLVDLKLNIGLPPVDENLYQAFAPLKANLQKLSLLTTPPFGHVPSFIASSCPNLQWLELQLLEPTGGIPLEYDDGCPIRELERCKQLAFLSVLGKEDCFSVVFARGLVMGCCDIGQLRTMHSTLLLSENKFFIGTLLSKLTSLQQLAQLQYPQDDFWTEMRTSRGHGSLKKLAVKFSLETVAEDHLEAMTKSLVEDFTALEELDLIFCHDARRSNVRRLDIPNMADIANNNDEEDEEEGEERDLLAMMRLIERAGGGGNDGNDQDDNGGRITWDQIARALSGLDRHSNISVLACSTDKAGGSNELRSALEQRFGERLQIVASRFSER